MKIAILSSASSIHTSRWANGLVDCGIEVHVISQHPQTEIFDSRVNLHILPYKGILGYFIIASPVKKLLEKIQPDLVNAHYASGYGTTARLVNYHPYIVSIWGSDVYIFPNKSIVHKWLIQKNLLAADVVASTSICMAKHTAANFPKLSQIQITPFGVDVNYIQANTIQLSSHNEGEITIGTVKSLSSIYGIDTLIKSFALLLKYCAKKDPELSKRLFLRIVGNGPQESELKKLSQQLGVLDRVNFVGRVQNKDIPQELGKIDVFVALSRSESFGVAVIEAGSARRPVVVSDAEGLVEVVINNRTGFVVEKDNIKAAADAILALVLNPNLRITMGECGYEHATKNYEWDYCINEMINLYISTIKKYNN